MPTIYKDVRGYSVQGIPKRGHQEAFILTRGFVTEHISINTHGTIEFLEFYFPDERHETQYNLVYPSEWYVMTIRQRVTIGEYLAWAIPKTWAAWKTEVVEDLTRWFPVLNKILIPAPDRKK